MITGLNCLSPHYTILCVQLDYRIGKGWEIWISSLHTSLATHLFPVPDCDCGVLCLLHLLIVFQSGTQWGHHRLLQWGEQLGTERGRETKGTMYNVITVEPPLPPPANGTERGMETKGTLDRGTTGNRWRDGETKRDNVQCIII